MTKEKSGDTSPKLNPLVFWPPFLLLVTAILLNFLSPDFVDAAGEKQLGLFSKVVYAINGWILGYFGSFFALVATLSLTLTIAISFTKFRKVKIGGADAEPLMSMWNWFSITICTTIAIGILFWSTAEPIKHLMSPPDFADAKAGSPEAATFALSTMYLHWSFTPYAIYCVASLMFAYAYYNLRLPYSLGSTLAPLLGKNVTGRGGDLIDAICLYALVAGMAAALGTGILMLGSGVELVSNQLGWFEIKSGKWLWAAITVLIVGTFVISSLTGLMKGIRILSDINTKLLFLMALVPLFFGAALSLIQFAGASLLDYGIMFVPRHLDLYANDWDTEWTIFYWAVWLAWAPITACFLGRIAYGRTVGEFLLVNFLFPSLFAIVWMTIFGGTAMEMQLRHLADPDQPLAADLYATYQNSGEQAVSYQFFLNLKFKWVLIVFYMFSAFVCFVTSSDSNMSAMSSISSTGVSPEKPEGSFTLKIIWGVTVGAVAWIMISFTGGVKGVKMLSNLGGFPAAFLQLLIIISLAKVVWSHQFESGSKFDSDPKAKSVPGQN